MQNVNRVTSKTFESNSGNVIRVTVSDREICIYKKDPQTLKTITKLSDRESNINYGYKIYFDEKNNFYMDALMADISKNPIVYKINSPSYFYIFSSINKISNEVDLYVHSQLKKIIKTIYPNTDLSFASEDDFYVALAKMGSPFLRSLPENINILGSKNFFSVKNRGLDYKQIIHKYLGINSDKMLKSVWSVIFYKNQQNGINESMIRFLGAFCKNVGPDYTYQLIEKLANNTYEDEFYCQQYINEKTLASIFKTVAPKKFINLITKNLYDSSTLLGDILGMLNQYDSADKIPEEIRNKYLNGLIINDNFKTLKELHDKIVIKYNLIKIEECKKPIYYNPLYLKLNEQVSSKFKFFVPQNTSDLIKWGIDLNICIGSYCNKALEGNTLLLGVLKDDKIAYCLEFMVDKNKYLWVEGTDAKVSDSDNLPLPVFKSVSNVWDSTENGWSYTYPPTSNAFVPEIVQFKGVRNSAPLEEDKLEIVSMIKKWSVDNKSAFVDAGINISDEYIGI